MKKVIRKYDLHDPQQYEDEREFWRSKTLRGNRVFHQATGFVSAFCGIKSDEG